MSAPCSINFSFWKFLEHSEMENKCTTSRMTLDRPRRLLALYMFEKVIDSCHLEFWHFLIRVAIIIPREEISFPGDDLTKCILHTYTLECNSECPLPILRHFLLWPVKRVLNGTSRIIWRFAFSSLCGKEYIWEKRKKVSNTHLAEEE